MYLFFHDLESFVEAFNQDEKNKLQKMLENEHAYVLKFNGLAIIGLKNIDIEKNCYFSLKSLSGDF